VASGQWLFASRNAGSRSPFRWNGWALLPLALIGLAVAAPHLFASVFAPLGFALERGFALVCHQRPERSFSLFGAPLAICARCLGIYLGAALGLLLTTSRRVAMHLFCVAAALNLLDVATELPGLHGNWPGVRFLLGLLFGASGALLISSTMWDVSRASYDLDNHYPGRLRP